MDYLYEARESAARAYLTDHHAEGPATYGTMYALVVIAEELRLIRKHFDAAERRNREEGI